VPERGRFGILGVEAPYLMQELFEESKTRLLLYIIDSPHLGVAAEKVNLWRYVKPDRRDALRQSGRGGRRMDRRLGDPERSHMRGECSMHREVPDLLKKRWPDMLLARLKKEQPGPVASGRKNNWRFWNIVAPSVSSNEKEPRRKFAGAVRKHGRRPAVAGLIILRFLRPAARPYRPPTPRK
jgi:hypothetical protein